MPTVNTNSINALPLSVAAPLIPAATLPPSRTAEVLSWRATAPTAWSSGETPETERIPFSMPMAALPSGIKPKAFAADPTGTARDLEATSPERLEGFWKLFDDTSEQLQQAKHLRLECHYRWLDGLFQEAPLWARMLSAPVRMHNSLALRGGASTISLLSAGWLTCATLGLGWIAQHVPFQVYVFGFPLLVIPTLTLALPADILFSDVIARLASRPHSAANASTWLNNLQLYALYPGLYEDAEWDRHLQRGNDRHYFPLSPSIRSQFESLKNNPSLSTNSKQRVREVLEYPHRRPRAVSNERRGL